MYVSVGIHISNL